MDKLRTIGLCMLFGAILLTVIGCIYGTIVKAAKR